MNTYIVKTTIELEADSTVQAEDLVMGLDIVDEDGHSVPAYIEIEEVIDNGS